jgi:hypothetical protein
MPVGAETIRRLLCDARLQTIAEDADGTPMGLGKNEARCGAVPATGTRAERWRLLVARVHGYSLAAGPPHHPRRARPTNSRGQPLDDLSVPSPVRPRKGMEDQGNAARKPSVLPAGRVAAGCRSRQNQGMARPAGAVTKRRSATDHAQPKSLSCAHATRAR